MARPLRLELAGGLYHIMSRGDRCEPIYSCDEDRQDFLNLFEEVLDLFNWRCHAYCLMGNHYHLLIETLEGNLSKGMRQLNSVYSQRYNRRHGKVGHVFQGRYKSILVEKEAYLLELSRYIVLNPVRAGMVGSAADWPWSSYPAMLGRVPRLRGLHEGALLSRFGENRVEAFARFQQFVDQGLRLPSPWAKLKNQIYLGSDMFVENMIRQIEAPEQLIEVPAAQRRRRPDSIEEYVRKSTSRDHAIALAHASGGYSQKELAAHFGLHYSRISRILRKAKEKT